MRRFLAMLAVAVSLVAACSSSPTTFSLTGASVDPQYWCPGGAKNAQYDVHATIDAHNGTSSVVTIQSVAAEMTLTAVKGTWLEKVGDRYEAEGVKFEPASVGAGSSATIKVTIPSACTSGSYGSSLSSSGGYRVTMRVTTSAGVHAISAGNQHQILAA
jgi:hypothetical protein